MLSFFFQVIPCVDGTRPDGILFNFKDQKQKLNTKKSERKIGTGESTGVAPVYSPKICDCGKEFVTDVENRTRSEVQENRVSSCSSMNPRVRLSGATPDFLQSPERYPNILEQRRECSEFYSYDRSNDLGPVHGLSDAAPDPPRTNEQKLNLDKFFLPDQEHNVTKNCKLICLTSYRDSKNSSFRTRENSAVQERCVPNLLSPNSRFRSSGATPDFLEPLEILPASSNRFCTSVYFNGLSGVTPDPPRSTKKSNDDPAIRKCGKNLPTVPEILKVMKLCSFAQAWYLQSDEQVPHPFRSETFWNNSSGQKVFRHPSGYRVAEPRTFHSQSGQTTVFTGKVGNFWHRENINCHGPSLKGPEFCTNERFIDLSPVNGESDGAPDPPQTGGQNANSVNFFLFEQDHICQFPFYNLENNNKETSAGKRKCTAVQEICASTFVSSDSRSRFSGATPDFLNPCERPSPSSNWICKCFGVHNEKPYNASVFVNGLSGATPDLAWSSTRVNYSSVCKKFGTKSMNAPEKIGIFRYKSRPEPLGNNSPGHATFRPPYDLYVATSRKYVRFRKRWGQDAILTGELGNFWLWKESSCSDLVSLRSPDATTHQARHRAPSDFNEKWQFVPELRGAHVQELLNHAGQVLHPFPCDDKFTVNEAPRKKKQVCHKENIFKSATWRRRSIPSSSSHIIDAESEPQIGRSIKLVFSEILKRHKHSSKSYQSWGPIPSKIDRASLWALVITVKRKTFLASVHQGICRYLFRESVDIAFLVVGCMCYYRQRWLLKFLKICMNNKKTILNKVAKNAIQIGRIIFNDISLIKRYTQSNMSLTAKFYKLCNGDINNKTLPITFCLAIGVMLISLKEHPYLSILGGKVLWTILPNYRAIPYKRTPLDFGVQGVLRMAVVQNCLIASQASQLSNYVQLSPFPPMWTIWGVVSWVSYMYISSNPEIMKDATILARGSVTENSFSIFQRVLYGTTVIAVGIIIYLSDYIYHHTSIPLSQPLEFGKKLVAYIGIFVCIEFLLRWTIPRLICWIKWRRLEKTSISFSMAPSLEDEPLGFLASTTKEKLFPVLITRVDKDRRQTYLHAKTIEDQSYLIHICEEEKCKVARKKSNVRHHCSIDVATGTTLQEFPGNPKSMIETIKALCIPKIILANVIWFLSKLLTNKPPPDTQGTLAGGSTIARKSLCMCHETWIFSQKTRHMIRLPSLADKTIQEGEVNNIQLCTDNPKYRVTSDGNIVALKVTEKGTLCKDPWVPFRPLLCSKHHKSLKTHLEKNNLPLSSSIETEDVHPEDQWDHFNSESLEKCLENLAPQAPGWGAPWTTAILFPTTGIILVMIDKLDDTVHLPPFVPSDKEPRIEIVTKMPTGKYARMCTKDEKRADGWSLDTMTKGLAELIYSSWKEDIDSLKESNEHWRHFMERFEELECEDREFDSFNAKDLEVKFRNTTRQNTWLQAITLKSEYDDLAERIKENFDENLFSILKESMKSDIKRHYGITNNFTDGFLEYQMQPVDEIKNNELVLHNEEEFESAKNHDSTGDKEVRSSGSESGFAISDGESKRSSKEAKKNQKKDEKDQESHLSALANELSRLQQMISDNLPTISFPKAPKFSDESKASKLINPALIRKIEDNDLEECEGIAEFPSDWVQKCGTFISFPYEDTEEYKEIWEPTEFDTHLLHKEFKYAHERDNFMKSEYLGMMYLRSDADDMIAKNSQADRVVQIAKKDIQDGKFKKKIKCYLSDHILSCVARHKLGKRIGSNLKHNDRITLVDFIPMKFESTFTCQLVDHKQITKGKYSFKRIEDVFSAALLLGSTYGLIMGSSYGNIFRNAATEMMKFFTNMDVQEDGPSRTFSVQRMIEIYDHLLFIYCEQVICTASAIAARMRVGSELALTSRCKRIAAFLKVPNIMDMSHPNGYFRAEFKRTIERKIATKKRADSWQQALTEDQDVLGTTAAGLKNIPWTRQICLEEWIIAAKAYADTIPTTRMNDCGKDICEDFSEFLPRIIENHPMCSKTSRFMCLKFNSHSGCRDMNCPLEHDFFTLARKNRDIELIMILLGGHKDRTNLESRVEKSREYNKMRNDYFNEVHRNASIPNQPLVLTDEGELIIKGEISEDVKKQVKAQSIASGLKKADDRYRNERDAFTYDVAMPWETKKSILISFTFERWLREINKWKKGHSPDTTERTNVTPEKLARTLTDNTEEILSKFEEAGWVDNAVLPPKIIDYTITQLPSDEVGVVDKIISWPPGACERKLFGEGSFSYDLGENVNGRVLSGSAVQVEYNSCYPLAVVAAAKGKGTSLAEIERCAYRFQQEQRDLEPPAMDKMNKVVGQLNGLSKSPVWIDKYVPHSIMKEANMWHSIKELNHGMMLEAMMWAWPTNWKEFERLGVIAVEVDHNNELDFVTHSDMNKHDKWVVIKVRDHHAKPVSFGREDRTVLSKEEILEMDWFSDIYKNEQRCCEQGIRPSDRPIEKLKEETKDEIDVFGCSDNKHKSKCQGHLIRPKSSATERIASNYFPNIQGFLGMNSRNPSMSKALELQDRHKLDEHLCSEILSKYPLSTLELVSIKLEESDNKAHLDQSNYALSILEMDFRSYPDREWCYKFNKIQEYLASQTQKAVSEAWKFWGKNAPWFAKLSNTAIEWSDVDCDFMGPITHNKPLPVSDEDLDTLNQITSRYELILLMAKKSRTQAIDCDKMEKWLKLLEDKGISLESIQMHSTIPINDTPREPIIDDTFREYEKAQNVHAERIKSLLTEPPNMERNIEILVTIVTEIKKAACEYEAVTYDWSISQPSLKHMYPYEKKSIRIFNNDLTIPLCVWRDIEKTGSVKNEISGIAQQSVDREDYEHHIPSDFQNIFSLREEEASVSSTYAMAKQDKTLPLRQISHEVGIKKLPIESNTNKTRVYPLSQLQAQSVHGLEYESIEELETSPEVDEYVDLFIKATYGKDWDGMKEFIRVARLIEKAWEKTQSIACVMKAYSDKIELVKRETGQGSKMTKQQWHNSVHLASFDPTKDNQINNIREDGIRISWNREKYVQENGAETANMQKVPIGNTKTIAGYEEEWCQDLWKDAAMGARVFGFFKKDPRVIPDAYPTPVFRVPKILPDRTISEKGRFVQDFRRINCAGKKEDYKKPLLPTFEDQAMDCLLAQHKVDEEFKSNSQKAPPVEFAKIDIDSAFKWVKINPLDTGATVAAVSIPTEWGDETILTSSLGCAFGMGGAPGLFSYYSEVSVAVIRKLFNIRCQMFVDDLAIVAKPDDKDLQEEILVDSRVDGIVIDERTGEVVGHRKNLHDACTKTKEAFIRAMQVLEMPTDTEEKRNLFKKKVNEVNRYAQDFTITEASMIAAMWFKLLLGPKAINEKKMKDEGEPEQNKILWGIEFDSKKKKACLPKPRMEQYKIAQHRAVLDLSHWAITYHDLQVQRGQLQWLSQVVVFLRPLLQSCNIPLKYQGGEKRPWEEKNPLLPDRKDTMTVEEWGQMWHNFSEVSSITRMMYQSTADSELKEVDWIDMIGWDNRWDLALKGVVSPDTTLIATDASMEKLGGINYTTGQTFQIDTDTISGYIKHLWNDDESKTIHVYELLAAAIGTILFTSEITHKGRWVTVLTDNQTALAWMLNQRSPDASTDVIIRNLILKMTHRRIRVCYGWISTTSNQEADCLSRIEAEDKNNMFKEEEVLKILKEILDYTPFKSLKRDLNPFKQWDIQTLLIWDAFPSPNGEFMNKQDWFSLPDFNSTRRILEVTSDMPSFQKENTLGMVSEFMRWEDDPSLSVHADIYIVHVPWYSACATATVKTIHNKCLKWLHTFIDRNKTKDIVIYDEFAQVGTVRSFLQGNGFTVRKWITNGINEGSKLKTRITTYWAYKGYQDHEIYMFNCHPETCNPSRFEEVYHEVDIEQLRWPISFKSKSKKGSLLMDGEPLVIGTTAAPSTLSKKGSTYQILDARGPIPLNLRSTEERAGDGDLKSKVIEIRSVVYTKDNKLGTPTLKYVNKWLPRATELEPHQKVKKGTRPWITLHSVYNMILTLKGKERREALWFNKISNIKTKVMDNISCQEVHGPYGPVWEIEVILYLDSEEIRHKMTVDMYKCWDDLYDLVVKNEPSVIAIPVREEMFPDQISRECGHQFNRCVGKIQSAVKEILFLVDNSEDQIKLGHLIQNYTLYIRGA